MTEITHMDERTWGPSAARRAHSATGRGLYASAPVVVCCYILAVATFLIGRHVISGADYVGFDNDDVMRLVEVRDFLAGQGWFDMHQYRLGLAGGTLMHWSRLVDLPIAGLIAFFSLFLDRQGAEAAALLVWPTLTLVPLLAGMAMAGARLGGRTAMHAALGLTSLYIICINRFQPGAIDHHNVQMALMALAAAMIVDPAYRPRSLGLAGVVAAVAVAIGAETTPQVAALCGSVALLWAWGGAPVEKATRAFALAFSATLSALFYLLVPPALYSSATCDALSTGFYVIGTVGGGLLFLAAAATVSRRGRVVRFAALGSCGAVIAALAVVVAPQCLHGPLSSLDPLLVRLWLDNISEAQSVLSMIRAEPFSAASFYAVPILAIIACLTRIRRDDRARQHFVLLLLLLVSFAVTLVQVRGSIFATLFAFLPLAAAIADLRLRYLATPKSAGAAVAFVAVTLGSAPPVWAFGGGLLSLAFDATPAAGRAKLCSSRQTLAPLARQPAGVVSAPSDMGVDILRYTRHRVLSAPYHRNQAGMLAELRIAMASPADAEAKLRAAGVTLLAYCPSEPEAKTVESEAPRGLYAALRRGEVPPYLQKLPGSGDDALDLYRVLPAGR